MNLDVFRTDILKQEVDLISQKINHLDNLRLKTRQMAILLWVAVIGLGLKGEAPSDNNLLFVLASFIPFPFWHAEASFRRYYKEWSLRLKAIRKFIRDGEYELADGTKSTLNDFLDKTKESSFPLFDYWAHKTVEEVKRKKETSFFRSFFNRRILWIYYPMVLISGLLAIIKLSGLNFIIAVLIAGLLSLLMVTYGIKFNKRIQS